MALYDAGKKSSTGRDRTGTEIFTPQWLVNDMLNMLRDANQDVFLPDKTFLEPSCGEGAFVVEILRRKFENCKTRKDYTVALGSVYGFDIQADNIAACIENVKALCAEYFKSTKAELEIIDNHYIMCDSLKIMRMMADENLYRVS